MASSVGKLLSNQPLSPFLRILAGGYRGKKVSDHPRPRRIGTVLLEGSKSFLDPVFSRPQSAAIHVSLSPCAMLTKSFP
jgi:hypothetical protein